MQERCLNVKLLFSKSGSKLLIIAKSINLSSHIFCFNFCGTTAEIGVGQEECPLSHCLAVYSLSDLLTSLKVIPESVSPPKLRGPRFCQRRREQLWPLILPASASPIMCPPADLTSDLFFKTLILFTQFTQLFFFSRQLLVSASSCKNLYHVAESSLWLPLINPSFLIHCLFDNSKFLQDLVLAINRYNTWSFLFWPV